MRMGNLKKSSDECRCPVNWNRNVGTQRERVFTASMADVFDDEVPKAWRDELWELIKSCGNLDWLLLTKRPENIKQMLPESWGNGWPNVWLGTTVENQRRANERIPILRDIPAVVRFLSVEPLIEKVELNLDGIDWVITGGESGRGYRTMEPEWAISVRDQCIESKVPFFFKQWGGISPKKTGSLLEGKEWKQFPSSPLR